MKIAVIVALLAMGGTFVGKELEVVRPRGVLMEKPQYWGRSLAELPRNTKVKIVDDSHFPWLKVEAKSKTGYVHASTFATQEKNSFGSAADTASLKPQEVKTVNMAARGLYPEVETAAATQANRKAALEKLSSAETVDALGPNPDEMRTFIEGGRLLGTDPKKPAVLSAEVAP